MNHQYQAPMATAIPVVTRREPPDPAAGPALLSASVGIARQA
jgi:hypothetical protein